jgi:hypothetical protein
MFRDREREQSVFSGLAAHRTFSFESRTADVQKYLSVRGGNAYVVGGTTAVDLPVTLGALQADLGGGDDGFLVKVATSTQLDRIQDLLGSPSSSRTKGEVEGAAFSSKGSATRRALSSAAISIPREGSSTASSGTSSPWSERTFSSGRRSPRGRAGPRNPRRFRTKPSGRQ